MDGGLIDRVETGAARCASALFAGAAGYAAYGISAMTGFGPELAFGAAGAGVLAYVPCSRLLARVGSRDARFALPDFELRDFELSEPAGELLLTEQVLPDEMLLNDRLDAAELLLTAADRVDAAAPLVLDDVLAEVGPGAQVIRLFDPAAMPAREQGFADLRGDGAPLSAPSQTSTSSDASQALSAALAELRRSLR